MATWAAVFDGTAGKATFSAVTYSDNTDVEFLGVKFTSLQTAGLLSNGGGTGRYFRYNAGSFRFRTAVTTYSTWPYTPVIGQLYDIKVECRSGGVELFIDGISQGVKSGTFGTFNIDTIGLFNTSSYADIVVQQLKITDFTTAANSIDLLNDVIAGSSVDWPDKSANNKTVTLIGTATDGSQWESFGGGGGISVTAESQDYSVTFYDASVGFTGEISVSGEAQAHSVTFYDATVDLTGEVAVIAGSQSYQVQFFDGQVSLVSGIEVQAQSQSYDVTFYDALVQLSGTIDISAENQAYSVTFYDGTVSISDVWTDKPKAVTNWANQSSVATVWTDK
jgi:hypothetical protein